MKREAWIFSYQGQALADAAQAKIKHHSERLEWWKQKKNEVTATIRSEGLEVDEKIALQYSNPKARDWDRGGEVLIRNDLRKQLAECFEKLSYHTETINEYEAWFQTLSAHPEQQFELDINDWLFFFSQPQ